MKRNRPSPTPHHHEGEDELKVRTAGSIGDHLRLVDHNEARLLEMCG
jgi:hypothetical protein